MILGATTGRRRILGGNETVSETYTTTRFFEQAMAADKMMFGLHEDMLRLMEELWAKYPLVSVTFDY